MEKEDLEKTLLELDEEAWLLHGEASPKPCIVIVGGAAFLLRDLTTRTVTHDIDVLMADSKMRGIIANYPNINGAVASFSDQIPYNFEDRLERIPIPSRAIDFMTPCTEDLIVMKLYAERPNDLQDVDGAAKQGLVDWDLLEELVYSPNEAQASALVQRRYREMVDAYERFKERCGK